MPRGINEEYTQAVFRVRRESWEQFKEKSGNASKLINAFIEGYLLGIIDTETWTALYTPEHINETVIEYVRGVEIDLSYKIKQAIAELETRLKKDSNPQ